MSGHLAVDFGTSNTVLAAWDETRGEGVPLNLPGFSRAYWQNDTAIPVVPSLIHYASDGRRWLGNQVLEQGLYHSRRTMRWMKRYISHRSPIKIRLEEEDVTPFKAGEDFLSTLLFYASQELDFKDEEIALSVPVEAFEHYENWLASVAEGAGFPRYRLIDEPSAAALGYGAHIQPGAVYLIFDFGGGTLHASMVYMDPQHTNASSTRHCRVLGKAGKSIGGTTVDQWIFEEVLRMNHHRDSEEPIRSISSALLVACEKAKEDLSNAECTQLSLQHPESGEILSAELTRSGFEDLLDRHDLYANINQTIRSAINAARERGYDESSINQVLMVGGSCQIPSVQRTLRQLFGREKVRYEHPMDAVARGAAAFAAGVDFYDHIQHDYAIRYLDAQNERYDYRVIVARGTHYPTPEPVVELVIKGAYNGQKMLGIPIFEMGARSDTQPSAGVELVFDPGGAARLMPVTPDEEEQRSLFWMNEHHPTFLKADPPVLEGEPCYEVQFYIDANKRLLMTARDSRNGKLVLERYPVIKLS